MGRPPCCDKSNVKRGLWTAEEDAKILAYVSTHGTGNWTSVPKKAGLKRCGKSCRLRWTNYLRPDLTRESFTPQEEEVIITLHNTLGSRWSLIAAQLPGRTDNDVKNHWNTKLRKKLLKMGIDPVTHKPISQVLAHYGSIGLPRPSGTSKSYPNRSQTSNTATRISCLNRDLRNAFMPKPQMGFSTPAQYPISNFSMATAMTTEMVPATPDGPFNNQPTWDLLAQLHAIKLVADASNQETLQPRMFFEGSSSSSSPSSSSITTTAAPLPFPSQPSQVQDSPSPSSFNWSEFLSEDAFQELSSTDSSSNQMQDVDGMLSPIPQLEFMGGHGFADAGGGVSIDHGNSISEAASGNGNSFVEAILDRESKMQREFPEIQILNDS